MLPKTDELKALCLRLGRKYVGFRGDPRAPIWFVGEAPGADEDQYGVPFVGSSGRELDRMLLEAGIPPQICCFVNPYKVRPPDNDLERFEETGITYELSREQFLEELRYYKPTFIVACGATSLEILCGFTIDPRDKETKISKWRGSILVSEELLFQHYVIGQFHPAYILREWSDRSVAVFIFRRLLEEYNYFVQNGRLNPQPERELIADPTFGEQEGYLKECLHHNGPISEDIELIARRVPICIAFSYTPRSAISISLFEGEPSNLRIIWRLIDAIHRKQRVLGQNWTTFDANWMEALGFDPGVARCDDTLVRHHVLHPEMSHKLDFQAMQYTRQQYWKDEGRGWTLRDGMTKLKRYNCLDASVTLEIFYEQEKEFSDLSGLPLGSRGLIEGKTDVGFGLEDRTRVTEDQYIKENLSTHTSYPGKIETEKSQSDSNYTTSAKTNSVPIQNTSNLSQKKNMEVEVENLEKVNPISRNFLGVKNLYEFYRNYEMPLARAFFYIDKRGVGVEPIALAELRVEIVKELNEKCIEISKNLNGRPIAYSDKMGEALAKQLNVDKKAILNIGSVQQLKEVLTNELKIKLKKDKHSGKESTGEESLNEAFAATGHPILKDLLRTRELNKILGTYVDARLCKHTFYSNYSVTGTVTGRRASRKNFLGYGSNGQNQPKHSDLGEKFNGVFRARPGCIFVACDQASAEEWIVQGIIADVCGDDHGIKELRASIETGISRHAVLASQIFGLPIEKTNNKECLEYFLGKKVRHAGNYDMRENTMAAQLAAAGFPTSIPFCAAILDKFHKVEPAIRGVFHKYVEFELKTKKLLRTPAPFLRERVFHGLRPYGDNGKVFREGYAYIPQSSIGDNNGASILYCEQHRFPGIIIADGHDSALSETEDNFESVFRTIQFLLEAYKRIIRFPNGFEVEIPIDFRIGYTIKGLKKCPEPSKETGLKSIYEILYQQQKVLLSTISGVQQAASLQPSSEVSGLIESSGNFTLTST